MSTLPSLAWQLLLRGRAHDVWHVHQYGAHAALVAFMGTVLRRPCVLKLTNSAGEGIAAVARAGARAPGLMAWLMRRFDAVVATTEEVKAEALAFGFEPAVIHRIGNGVDLQQFAPASADVRAQARRSLGLADQPTALFAGRLVESKNPTLLLRAWQQARATLARQWQLVLVGDGPLRASLQMECTRAEYAGSVRVVGPQSDMPAWYRAADIYLCSSNHEGLSNTLLEAMASGLPVVSTAVSGVGALVASPNAGRVVPVGGVAALAAALDEMTEDETARQTMGNHAREAVQAEYSIDAVALGHLRLYRSLCGAGTP
jgi:glycosyltransferase involved in cell wall biosynthesis